jgi:NADH-quinone oxidoreductase subunit N
MLLGIAVLFALPAVQLTQSQMADGAGRGVTSVVVFPLNAQAAVALLFYLFMYLFMNAGVFVTAAAIAEKIGSENIKDYAGLGRRAPILATAMVVFLFALIGIPLTVGFGAKLKLLLVLFAAGTSVGYIGVVVLGINTVVAAFYYFRVIRQMWLTQTDAPPVRELTPTGMLAAALVVPVIGLFIAYNWVDDQAQTFGRLYGQPTVETAAPPPVGAAARPALPGLAGPGLSGL